MKKRIIALSVLAALGAVAGSAVAQTYIGPREIIVNPAGIGQKLILPYFSTQGGNATMLNLVNTDTKNGKILKVRFRGASNSDDLLDFQVFMSPGDVWTASITKGADGFSYLTSSDNTCVLPGASYPWGFAGAGTANVGIRLPYLTGDALANETREGYAEVINMLDVMPSITDCSAGPLNADGTCPSVVPALFAAIKHDSTGKPTCASLGDVSNSSKGATNPTTGVFGNWLIINVPQTTTWSGDAVALEVWGENSNPYTGYMGPVAGEKVYWPQDANTSALGNYYDATTDPLFLGGLAIIANYDLPDLSTPYMYSASYGWEPQYEINHTSWMLSATQVAVEYITDPGIAAQTDWVVTFPTRRYYAAVDYSGPNMIDNWFLHSWPGALYFRSIDNRTVWKNAPNIFLGGKTGNYGCQPYQIATVLGQTNDGIKLYDREEASQTLDTIVISPGQGFALCGEVSVISVNPKSASETSALAASVARKQIKGKFANGWAQLNVSNNFIAHAVEGDYTCGSKKDQQCSSHTYALGLPMLVQQFTKAVNGGVSAGMSGTFGGRWTGRNTVRGDIPPFAFYRF